MQIHLPGPIGIALLLIALAGLAWALVLAERDTTPRRTPKHRR